MDEKYFISEAKLQRLMIKPMFNINSLHNSLANSPKNSELVEFICKLIEGMEDWAELLVLLLMLLSVDANLSC